MLELLQIKGPMPPAIQNFVDKEIKLKFSHFLTVISLTISLAVGYTGIKAQQVAQSEELKNTKSEIAQLHHDMADLNTNIYNQNSTIARLSQSVEDLRTYLYNHQSPRP